MKYVIPFVCFALFIESIGASFRPRIVGGYNAEIKSFPYLASLRYLNSHFCGGCIISEKHVLTAAHCILDVEVFVPPFHDLTVNTGTSSSAQTGNTRLIAGVTIHPDFTNKRPYLHDIAVITLSDKITFNAHEQKIGLASNDVISGTDAFMAGWGVTSMSKNAKLSVQLQMLKMTLLDNVECRSHSYDLPNTQLCAYHSKGHGACHGDSGGPLVDDINQIVGIFSWFYKCDGRPEVYTNVYAYRDFIASAMKK